MSQMVFQQKSQGGPYIPPWAFMNQGGGGNQQSPAAMLAMMRQSQQPTYSPMDEMKAAVMGQAAIESLKYEFSRDDREQQLEQQQQIFNLQKAQLESDAKHRDELSGRDKENHERQMRQLKGATIQNQGGLINKAASEAEQIDVGMDDWEYQQVYKDLEEQFGAGVIQGHINTFNNDYFSMDTSEETMAIQDYAGTLLEMVRSKDPIKAAAAYRQAKDLISKTKKTAEGGKTTTGWFGTGLLDEDSPYKALKFLVEDSTFRGRMAAHEKELSRKRAILGAGSTERQADLIKAITGVSEVSSPEVNKHLENALELLRQQTGRGRPQ